MNFPGFPLNLNLPDLWQQEGVRHLREGRDVIIDAPTGAGKTRVFEWLVEGGHLRRQAVYTVPTRALANDKRMEWARRGWNTGIITGEIAENTDAPVVVATLETQRERLLRGNGPELMVIDEYQMIADPQRGTAYETAVALAPLATRLLLLSGSVANTGDVAEWLRRLGRSAEVVSIRERPVPLEEMPLEQLPRPAPRQVTGFWPRLAAGVLLSGFGPLLIFAPHRADAERIARRIASALPPADPLVLTREQEQILGRDLAALVRARVAMHHSGLTWQQRAGIIEPLAKAGQLRVVAATMGLAAGINFSMRSVVISDTRYFDGRMDRDLSPDELLQMFGRAGRRGLDETGYVIVSRTGPRLADAARRRLHRVNQVDWPILLRVMDRAATTGDSPFGAAARFCNSLFSRQRIVLGIEADGADSSSRDAEASGSGHAMFGVTPSRTDIRNSRGEWEEKRRDRTDRAPLGSAFLLRNGRLQPALSSPDIAGHALSLGRTARLTAGPPPVFGRELAIAVARDGGFVLTRHIRSLAGHRSRRPVTREDIEHDVLPALLPHLQGAKPAGLVERESGIALRIDVSAIEVPVYRDSAGVPLVDPPERSVALDITPDLRRPGGPPQLAARNSTAWAWRKLGLIEPDGTPTRRGTIFSWFQGGEGLAIAAALEDESLPAAELAVRIANLRGGRRFHGVDRQGTGDRLAAACLQAYGAANFEGYLEAGLPPEYGQSTADLLVTQRPRLPEGIGPGDLERALAEWISLLRQVVNAPGVDWHRWREFQSACAAELALRAPRLPARNLPALPAAQLHHQPVHHRFALPG